MGPICRDVGDKMSSHEIGNVLRDERFASLESIVWADSELAPLVTYIQDRILEANMIPPLADLIDARASELNLGASWELA